MSDYSGEQWLEQKLRDRIRELEAALVLREIGKLARSVSPDTALLPDPTKPYECPVCRRPIDADEIYGSCANTKDGHHRRVIRDETGSAPSDAAEQADDEVRK